MSIRHGTSLDGNEGGMVMFQDGLALFDQQPELGFQKSIFEKIGLTATYDLPDPKSLSSFSTTSKQRLARITFSNVIFRLTVVAKHKLATCLEAKVHNADKMTLLQGQAGLITPPRCSTDSVFCLNLGVDSDIRVSYPKPMSSAATNTRGAWNEKPVRITVLDQVPVSEDARLHVDILRPKTPA
ncbi:hypothetical protein F5X96DRAFT_674820 [Biscogniauxia mediterranea]|nr:hypothetical protein F5X96DRAFT_674820 [Biscogniauxia mediterranea]